MHEYAGLCLSVYGRDPEYDLMQYHNDNTSTPEGVEILKARLHTMCKFSRFWFTLDYADDWKAEDMHADGRSRAVVSF